MPLENHKSINQNSKQKFFLFPIYYLLTSLFGTTLGFLAGLYFIYALDYVIASIEKNSASNKYEGTTTLRESSHLLDSQTFQLEDREFKEREINSDGSEHQVDGIV